MQYKLDLSVRGSTENVTYYVSANMYSQSGIIKESGMDRYTLRTNLDIKLNDKVKFGTRTNISSQQRDLDRLGIARVNRAVPTYSVFDEDGNYNEAELPNGDPFDNPMAYINESIRERHVTDILSNFYVEFKPMDGLVIKSTLAPRLIWRKDNQFLSSEITRLINPEAQISNIFTQELLQENTVSYTPELGDSHSLNLLAGFTWQTSTTEATFAFGTRFNYK